MMTGLFLTNYITHHQKPFYDELNRIMDGTCYFFEMERLPEDRIKLGFEEINAPYKASIGDMSTDEINEKYGKLFIDADFVIYNRGEELLKDRIKAGKLTFYTEERWCKQKRNPYEFIREYLRFWKHHNRYQNGNYYDLGISAYYAGDMKRHFAKTDNMFQWAYFPESVNKEPVKKGPLENRKIEMIWVARFIDWKHPEAVLKLAERLINDGSESHKNFHITMLGVGELLETVREDIENMGLKTYVDAPGSVPASKVREYMNASDIFLFTSDFQEGWGVVLNEAMNSCCACVASHEPGSVPVLMKDKENGLIYKNGNDNDLYEKVTFLLDNPEKIREYGIKAYDTIERLWSPKVAAERFYIALQDIMNKGSCDRYSEGPLSHAKILENDWIY